MVPWGTGDRRAQGDVISVVLLLAITVAGATAVVALGGDAIGGIQQSATTGAAEQSMTQLDSKASLVAHGESDAQRVELAGSPDATRRVDADAGWMNITVRNATTGEVEAVLTNTTLGAVVYRDGDSAVAYQGGGVWRRSGKGSSMVSPPEFHYRGTTLTLPLVRIRGDETLNNDILVRKSGPSASVYPDSDSGLVNPLDGGKVVVTVNSEYYTAWGQFFESRVSGDVVVDHANETATIELVVPTDASFSNVVASTAPDGITANGGSRPKPYQSGVPQPSADSLIESRIEECETNASACIESFDQGDMDDGDTYFVDGDAGGDYSVDTADGNVTLVADGAFEPGTVSISGGGTFSVYARNDFTIDGNDPANAGGTADQLRVIVHSDGDVGFNGEYTFVGFVYAPGSDVDLNGGGPPFQTNVEGGIIGETIDINGNPNKFEYDSSIGSIDIDVTATTAPQITYLHVSVTEVEISED